MPTNKEEIEAAAKAIYKNRLGDGKNVRSFDALKDYSKESFRHEARLALEAAEVARWQPIENLPADYNGFILVKLAEAHLMLGNITSASVCNGVVHFVGSYFAFDAPVIVEFQPLPTMYSDSLKEARITEKNEND